MLRDTIRYSDQQIIHRGSPGYKENPWYMDAGFNTGHTQTGTHTYSHMSMSMYTEI